MLYIILVIGFLCLFLFLGAALATLFTLGRLVYLLAQRRARDAGRLALRWSVAAAVYLTAVVLVSVATPQHRLQIGQKRCFDEWCLTVTSADWRGEQVAVDLHVASEAKRVTMRELGVNVLLVDSNGRKYWPVGSAGPPLDQKVGPGESFDTRRVFRVPQDAGDVGLAVDHGLTPALVIIGDSGSLLHRPTLIMLRSRAASAGGRLDVRAPSGPHRLPGS